MSACVENMAVMLPTDDRSGASRAIALSVDQEGNWVAGMVRPEAARRY